MSVDSGAPIGLLEPLVAGTDPLLIDDEPAQLARPIGTIWEGARLSRADPTVGEPIVELIGKSYQRVGTADRLISMYAEETGAAQARFAGERFYPVTAESMLDSFAFDFVDHPPDREIHRRHFRQIGARRKSPLELRWRHIGNVGVEVVEP